MLVLTRKLNEVVYIDDNIAITVLEVANGRVKLGFQAPQSRRIKRAEIAGTIAIQRGHTLAGSSHGYKRGARGADLRPTG